MSLFFSSPQIVKLLYSSKLTETVKDRDEVCTGFEGLCHFQEFYVLISSSVTLLCSALRIYAFTAHRLS